MPIFQSKYCSVKRPFYLGGWLVKQDRRRNEDFRYNLGEASIEDK